MKFTDLLLSERIRLMHDTKNVNLIYDILEKHFPSLTRTQLIETYNLKGDFIKNRLFISSRSTEAIINMLNMTTRLGLNYESISNFELRVDLYSFINKIL